MSVDLLSPEFIAFTEEVKKLYAEKEQKVAAFKEIWLKHKAEIEILEDKAQALQQALCTGGSPVPVPAPAPAPADDTSAQAEGMSVRRQAVKK